MVYGSFMPGYRLGPSLRLSIVGIGTVKRIEGGTERRGGKVL